ncbi:MAG: endonuclease/exonuclease/phosphatase family protein, partial [Enterococcus sp.]
MKFLTLNCHSWLEENQAEKLTQLVQNIATNDYDVICLQEVNQLMTSEIAVLDDWFIPSSTDVTIHEDNFALRLQEQLQCLEKDYYWSWCYNHIGYDRFYEGVAILAKTPFFAKDSLVSKTSDVADYHTRRILTALTEVEGQLLQVVSGHFSWWTEGFSFEWEKTQAFFANNSYPLVLMGDFNNPAHTPGYELILTSDWQL